MIGNKKKIINIVGTRPEIIKVAPVIHALHACSWATPRLITTGQHRELLAQHLQVFSLKPDGDLEVMRHGQTLSALTSHLTKRLEELLSSEKPDLVLSQGDTTTVMATAMVCFYLHIPFVHLEAGLRSGDLHNPFPEEYNRKVAAQAAALHLAPTTAAKNALTLEGVPEKSIIVTGNTVIDALHYIKDRLPPCRFPVNPGSKLILLTAHRRENLGASLAGIFKMLKNLVYDRQDVEVLYPVHPNPLVSEMAYDILGGSKRIHLVPPLDYLDFIGALSNAYLVLTDSGGVQEEAPALGKPVLVLREVTERHEAVDVGVASLVGTDPARVEDALLKLLDDYTVYSAMIKGGSPYGDGLAAQRSVEAIGIFLGVLAQRTISEFAT